MSNLLALNAATVQTHWCLEQPQPGRTRLALALGLLADTDTRATIAAGSLDTEGRRAKGSHSDPTLRAATTLLDVAIPDARTARTIRGRVVDLAETARFLRTTIAGRHHHGPDTLTAAHQDLLWCQTIPHQIGAWIPTDDAERQEVNHACRHAEREAQLLAGQVAVVLRAAVRPPEPKPKQKRRVACTSCARFGLEVDVEHYRDRCRNCGDFQRAHACRPTERICRMWFAQGHRAHVTPGMILEAKAAASTRKGRRSA